MTLQEILSRIPAKARAAIVFALALVLSITAAWWLAKAVEASSARAANSALLSDGITWAEVRPSGLQVRLYGTAPNEAARYRAANLVGTVVDSARIRDRTEVPPPRAIEAPRFSVEILRNDDGISLIGLLPTPERPADAPANADATDPRDVLSAAVTRAAPDVPVSDMLEVADFPPPEGWAGALDFGVAALQMLPRAKISVAADAVAVTAIAESEGQKRSFEAELQRLLPAGLPSQIDISAPRPVLTPFTLRLVKDARGARFDACSADTDAARKRIIAAANAAGVAGNPPCTIGLGVPSPSWGEATATAIAALAEIGAGSVTFSDADVTLMADPATPQAVFDRVVGDLQASLPKVFSLKATLPPKPTATEEGPAELTAELTAEGRVVIRGRLTDALQKAAVESFAKARFGANRVLVATRPDPDLPEGWPVRAMAGLESLAMLTEGNLIVRADTVELRGATGNQDTRARIAQLLSAKLGQGQTFSVDVRYDEALDPVAALPSPAECMVDVQKVLARQKLTFTPGSTDLSQQGQAAVAALAEVLTKCPPMPIEIAGHTDAQGSTGGNQALSQARAEAVVLALQGRRVDVSGIIAKGYGEGVPIADNGTEEGREANRRIEFQLLKTQVAEAPPTNATPTNATPANAPPSDAPAADAPAATPADTADTSPSVAPKNREPLPKPRPKRP